MLRASWMIAATSAIAPLVAQTVHVVGPGGVPQIQTAINAAANGDVIVIHSGTYLPFTLAKDLSLTAAPGATVDVQPPLSMTPTPTTVQPPQRAAITGLRFRNGNYVITPFNQVRVLSGTVHFADVAFESHNSGQPVAALLVQNASVAMQRCIALGGGLDQTLQSSSGEGHNGMEVRHGAVAAVDCIFMGGALGWTFAGHAGHAVVVDDGNLHLVNCIAVGGRGFGALAGSVAGDGVNIATPSRVFLADCQAYGGLSSYGAAGRGLANFTNAAAVHARSTFGGGAGTPAGAAVVGPLATGPLVGFATVTPAITLGTTWTIDYRTTPTTPMLALWSDSLAPVVSPLLVETAWLPASGAQVAALGVTNANGLLALAFPVPPTPSLLHRSFFVHAVTGWTLPLEAAPPVGGAVR